MSISLDPKVITNISNQVYKRFPEVSGAKPSVKTQPEGKKLANGASSFLLTYRGCVNVGDGQKMKRWVRVVVNDRGKILKITTSR